MSDYTFRNASNTKSVSVTGTVLSGPLIKRDGSGPTNVQVGSNLVVEALQLVIKGTDQDEIAQEIQDFADLLMQAVYHKSERWQTEPVIIVQQGETETNPRYAKIDTWLDYEYPGIYSPGMRSGVMDGFVVTVTRTHPWTDKRVGDIGSALTLAPQWEHSVIEKTEFDAVSETGSSVVTDVFRNKKPALEFDIDSTPNPAYGVIDFVDDQQAVSCTFIVDPDTMDIGIGNDFHVFRLQMDAAVNGNVLVVLGILGLEVDGYYLNFIVYEDDGVSYTVGTGKYITSEAVVIVDYAAALTSGDDDGTCKVRIDGTVCLDASGLDNDQMLPDTAIFGGIGSLDAGTSGKFYMRDIWLALEIDGEPTRTHVANYDGTEDLGTVRNWDDGVGATILGVGDDLFPAAEAQNNAIQFNLPNTGDPLPKVIVIPKLSVAGDLTTTTLGLYCWNGSAWTALTLGTNYLVYPGPTLEASLEQADEDIVLVMQWPSNATDNTGPYLRLREDNASPSYATHPALSETDYPYAQHNPYVEIPRDQFGGDQPLKLLVRLRADYGGDENVGPPNISRVLIGSKSRGLEKFVSHLNAGAEGNPSDWTVTQGTDATKTARPDCPNGYYSDVDFSGDATMLNRVQFSGSGMAKYWEGEYIAIVRCQQSGGSSGDINMKLRTYLNGTSNYDPHADTPEFSPQGVDEGYEWVDVGLITIPFGQKFYDDDLDGIDLIFQIFAERTTGSATLEIVELILIPIDEGQVGADDRVSDLDYGPSALRGATALDIDAGLIDWRAQKYVVDSNGDLKNSELWILMQKPLELQHKEKTRLYFALEYYPTEWDLPPLAGTPGMHVSAEIYAHKQFTVMRGDQ